MVDMVFEKMTHGGIRNHSLVYIYIYINLCQHVKVVHLDLKSFACSFLVVE
jgi:hypothetical protein